MSSIDLFYFTDSNSELTKDIDEKEKIQLLASDTIGFFIAKFRKICSCKSDKQH